MRDYSHLADPNYIFHFGLGHEYVFDAADGKGGGFLHDSTSGTFFHPGPGFPFPYRYDFSLNSVVYYHPDMGNPGPPTTRPDAVTAGTKREAASRQGKKAAQIFLPEKRLNE